MPVIKVSDAAEEDLKGIWARVADHNRVAANNLIQGLIHRFRILGDYPQMGRDQNQLLVNLRSFGSKTTSSFINRMLKGSKFYPSYMAPGILREFLNVFLIPFKGGCKEQ